MRKRGGEGGREAEEMRPSGPSRVRASERASGERTRMKEEDKNSLSVSEDIVKEEAPPPPPAQVRGRIRKPTASQWTVLSSFLCQFCLFCLLFTVCLLLVSESVSPEFNSDDMAPQEPAA